MIAACEHIGGIHSNVPPDDGPVGSLTCRSSVFLKMSVCIKWQLCAFVG